MFRNRNPFLVYTTHCKLTNLSPQPHHIQLFGVNQIDSENKKRRRRRSRKSLNLQAEDCASTCATSVSSSGSSCSEQTQQPKRGKEKKPLQQIQQIHLSQEERANYVALDCEMVGTGQRGNRSTVARVTVVAFDGSVVLDEMVRQEQEVTDFRTFVSGITKEDLENATWTLAGIREKLQELLSDKILVGHALKNDLRALGISHPWYNTRDTAKYEQFMHVRFDDGVFWPKKLKDLAKTRLNREIQQPGVPHCPREDAIAAMDLYKLVSKNWEKAVEYKLRKTREIEAAKQNKKLL
ncbi:MAG: hypothetical protein SGILL_008711, partial [Bacillariaceae sp.]